MTQTRWVIALKLSDWCSHKFFIMLLWIVEKKFLMNVKKKEWNEYIPLIHLAN